MADFDVELAKKRLLSKVVKTDSCWLWDGALNSKGYGSMGFLKKGWLAHRLSYTAFKGPIPDGLLVCHSCDVPSCVNPDHLWLGTTRDNQRDSESKGRAGWQNGEPSQTRRTHCRRGHDYSVVGVYVQIKNGKANRDCMECRRIANRNRPSRRKYQAGYQREKYYPANRLKILAGKKARRSGSDGAMDSATDF